jgi:hypothetical protein
MMGLLIPFETAHLTRVRRRMPGIFGPGVAGNGLRRRKSSIQRAAS